MSECGKHRYTRGLKEPHNPLETSEVNRNLSPKNTLRPEGLVVRVVPYTIGVIIEWESQNGGPGVH